MELVEDLLPAGPWRNNHKNVSALVSPASHRRPALSQPRVLLSSFSLQLLPSLLSLCGRNWGPLGSPVGCLGSDEGEERGDPQVFGPSGVKPCPDAEGPLQGMGCRTSRHAQARVRNLG